MKGKRILALLSLGILCGGLMISCTREKEVKFDITQADMENKLGNVEIKRVEPTLDRGAAYNEIFYNDNEVYGSLFLWKGGEGNPKASEYPIRNMEKKYLYTLNENGELKEVNIENKEGTLFADSGVNQIILESNEVNDYNKAPIYSRNLLTGEKQKIGEGDYKVNGKILEKYCYFGKVDGNEDYVFIQNFESVENSDTGSFEEKPNSLEIVNLKDNKKYSLSKEQSFIFTKVVYSKITDSFYGVDRDGNIMKVILDGENIKLEKYDKIELEGFQYQTVRVNVNSNGEIVFLNYATKGTFAAIYNPKSKKATMINNVDKGEFIVLDYYPKQNKILIQDSRQDGGFCNYYIAEFSPTGQLQIVSKVGNKEIEGKSTAIIGNIMSDDGEEMIITEGVYDKDYGLERSISYFIKFK